MNANFDFSYGELEDDECADERAEADRWAHIRAVAAAIADADLDDFEDCVRALHAARFTSRDFMPVLDEAIEYTRGANLTRWAL